jgi:cytochrome c-type biogenesis protein CcmH/NrfG
MKPKILCPECQTEIKLGVEVCPTCGKPIEWSDAGSDPRSDVHGKSDSESDAPGRSCPGCGTENPPEAEFCKSCGSRLQGSRGKGKQQEKAPQRADKNRDTKKKDAESSPLFSPKVIFGFLGILVIFVVAMELFSGREQAPVAQQTNPGAQQMQMPAANLQIAAQITELEKQVAANPTDYKAMLSLANLAHDGRFFDKAIAYYKRYLEKNTKDANARVDLGICYFETDKLVEAESEMKAALKYDPRHIQAHFNLGIVTLKARKFQESNDWFRKTIAIAPPNSEMGQQAKQFLEQHSSPLIQNK